MSSDQYIYAAYGLTWVVLILFTLSTLRRVRRAEQGARAAGAREES